MIYGSQYPDYLEGKGREFFREFPIWREVAPPLRKRKGKIKESEYFGEVERSLPVLEIVAKNGRSVMRVERRESL